jgi:hypothetical protein
VGAVCELPASSDACTANVHVPAGNDVYTCNCPEIRNMTAGVLFSLSDQADKRQALAML